MGEFTIGEFTVSRGTPPPPHRNSAVSMQVFDAAGSIDIYSRPYPMSVGTVKDPGAVDRRTGPVGPVDGRRSDVDVRYPSVIESRAMMYVEHTNCNIVHEQRLRR